MSNIDDLIGELCPEGVPSFRLGDVLKRRKGIQITAGKMKTLSRGDARVRVFAGGQTLVDVDSAQFPREQLIWEPGIIVKSRGHIDFAYWESPYTHKSEIWSYTQGSHEVDVKYVYYLLKSKKKFFQELARSKSVKMPQLTVGDTDDFMILVPPLEVQSEIVSILDKFTQLEAALEAELEARRVQYEETRNSLLNFDQDLSSHPLSKMIREMCPDGVASATIESLCTTYRPKTTVPRAKYLVHGSLPIVDQSQNFIAGYTEDLQSKVSVGPCVVFGDHTRERKFVDFDFAAGADGTVILIPANLMDPKFFFFSLASLAIPSRGYNRHWTIAREMKVALPPLGIQREIVSILDKMDALVNDISFGLPAEIAARSKQYEYYRNKLLTFKELDAA